MIDCVWFYRSRRLTGASLPLYNGCMNEIEIRELQGRLEVAERERDAARADAERYRHIRKIGNVHLADATMNGVYYHIRYVQHYIPIKPLDIVDHDHRFDAAVDSAMAAKEKG